MSLNDRAVDPVTEVNAEAAVARARTRADDPDVVERLDALIEGVAGARNTLEARLVREMMQTALKLIPDGRDLGELKLFSNSVKELRYAHTVFGRFREPHKVTIFGSARTPDDHPDFTACVDFSKGMADAGWMSITGAGLGIMKAGHVGPGRQASFGVAIRLPFETNANPVIAGDEKLIHFRYFFTRKLMFVSQAEAVALFPGGFGTLDEAFEALTLVQTGKASPMPIVMVEGHGGDYWATWDQWVRRQLLDRGWISPEDPSIYHIATDPADGVKHILDFYTVYHSSRYVRDQFVIRLKKPLSPETMDGLNLEFKALVKEGTIRASQPLEGETDHLDLPRIAFTHTRSKFGMLRRLIDRINKA